MYIFKEVAALQGWLQQQKTTHQSIGFVPTMGALHQGHISLVSLAKENSDIVVCSIFVNPTQFNNSEDLQKYPITTDADIALLASAGCHALFLPSVSEIYPDGTSPDKVYNLGYAASVLEGAFRPGHFQGVAQVVDRLLQIVEPNVLLLGQKDYQQCAVIKSLLNITEQNIRLLIGSTLREPDGLAMSSRNTRLTEAQRAVASLIYQCLVSVQAKKSLQAFSVIQKECEDILTKKGFKAEYLVLADADTLEPLASFDETKKMVVLIAAFLGNVRLIDNLLL